MDLALYNQQRLIYHKTQPNQTPAQRKWVKSNTRMKMSRVWDKKYVFVFIVLYLGVEEYQSCS